MREEILEKKIDLITTLMLLTSALLVPAIPAEAEKCPRFTEEPCQTETEFRPGIEIVNEGLKYEARDAGELVERNFVTYNHSPITVMLVILIALSPLSFRIRKEMQSRV
jgi:hypothetical protein